MKTMQFLRRTGLFSAMVMMFALFTANKAVAQEYDPTGVWIYEVEMPEGTLTGEMTITKTDKGYEVVIKSDVYGTLELEDVTFKEMVLTGVTEVDGGDVDFEFQFDGDVIEGIIGTDDGELSMTAKRKKD
ncbi:MAG TPA: hypothetical protein VIN11_02595 [Roseivirga sp.]